MLAPFNVAQEALEGDKYVNLSLLPLIIEKLKLKLYDFLASIDSEAQPQLHTMLSDMLQDFASRWGKHCLYSLQTVRGDRSHITGIPKLTYCASMLNPCTRRKTSSFISLTDQG